MANFLVLNMNKSDDISSNLNLYWDEGFVYFTVRKKKKRMLFILLDLKMK